MGEMMNVLFLGDSITEGVPGVSYTEIIKKQIENIKIVNRGVGGDTVSSLFRRVKKMSDLSNYDHIVLFIGVNDVYGKLNHTYRVLKILKNQKWAKNKNKFIIQYNELINYILTYNKNIIVIPPLLLGEDVLNKWNLELDELRNEIVEIIQKNDLPILRIDHSFKDYLQNKEISAYLPLKITELLQDVTKLTNPQLVDEKSNSRGLHITLDGVHLNSTGAKMIANEIIKRLEL